MIGEKGAQRSNIPQLLQALYDDVSVSVPSIENERLRLAARGLMNAFEKDCQEKGVVLAFDTRTASGDDST